MDHLEGRAPCFHVEPLAAELVQAPRFQVGEAAFERELADRIFGGFFEDRIEIARERGARAELPPDARHEGVQQPAAVARIQAGLRRLERFRAEAVAREGAKRAGRLVRQHARAAANGCAL